MHEGPIVFEPSVIAAADDARTNGVDEWCVVCYRHRVARHSQSPEIVMPARWLRVPQSERRKREEKKCAEAIR